MKGAWVLFAAVLGWSAAARADVVYTASPRSGALQLKLGSYNPGPQIDKGTPTKPYESTFGSTGLLLFELQYDRYIWQKVGAFGIGFSVGYGEKYGNATVIGATDETVDVKTALLVAPLKLTALYNFDQPALKWHIPLVPYVRGGAAVVPWWSLKNGHVEFVNNQRGAGAKWGWTVAGGLAFQLDVLEPRMARDFDNDLGVNHTYVFAEYDVLSATGGFGPNLSANYLTFGVSFEF